MSNKLFKSFGFAIQGIVYSFKTQWNFRFHIFMAVFVLGFGFFYKINSVEWIVILLCIALVLFAELVNTAIEAMVDLYSPEIHPLAKIAKDTAAGSVLILAFFSAVIGLIIFVPYVFNL